MNCMACGEANREGARFCDGCGAALGLRCAHCGVELRTTARFCDECGAPTTVGPSSEAASTRKTVTVLFADLAGSTTMEERLDPESVKAVMDRFFASLREEIEARRGR